MGGDVGRRTKKTVKALGMFLGMFLVAVLAIFWMGGTGTATRARIQPSMGLGEVLRIGHGWLVLNAVPVQRPLPETVVRVSAHGIVVQGLGKEDGTFRYGTEAEEVKALERLMRGTVWRLTFGYVAVPRREYFDVDIDAAGKVATVSAVRHGKLD